jgi:glyoxylase-like metal-dependent hydrolase (beta-lactamase superfamily II)
VAGGAFCAISALPADSACADQPTPITLVEQLAQMNVRPEQVKYVGISHFHADHTGQLGTLPNAMLLISEKDVGEHWPSGAPRAPYRAKNAPTNFTQ